MNKSISKKLLSIVLSICLIFSVVLPISVNAQSDSESLKAAYETAQAEYDAAKAAFDEAESKAVFKEDFEGETKKVGIISGSNVTETIIVDDNGNKYAQLVSKGGGTSYGMLEKVTITSSTRYTYVFDYKVTGATENSVQPYRYNQAGTSEIRYDYLNNTSDWTVHTFTGSYTATEIYYKINFINASAGAEVLVDNFAIMTETDYNTYATAKENLKTKKATLDDAKAAYEASLSPEELAYIKAKEAMVEAEKTFESVKNDICVFYEDFEGETKKVGIISGSNVTETIVTDDNGNKYAKVVSSGGGTTYGMLENVTITPSIRYTYVFDYKVSGATENSVQPYRYTQSGTGNSREGYLNNTSDWTLFSFTGYYNVEEIKYWINFINASAGAEVLVDNFAIMTETDYNTYATAKANYDTAVAAYEAAKDAYDESMQESEDEKASRIDFQAKQAAYNAAKTAYDTANDKYAFYEDYSNSNNVKMGYVAKGDANTGSRCYTVDTLNGYAILTATGTAWYGVSLSTANYTAFSVTSGEEYILKFRYHAASGDLQRYLKIYGTAAATSSAGNMLTPTSLTINGENKNNLISSAVGCKLNDYGLTSDWVDVEIKFTPTTNYAYFYLHTVNGTTTHLDDISVMSKSNYDALLAAEENLTLAKCEYAASFEVYKPYVADKLDKYTDAVEIANAHYIDNICDDAIVVEATCSTPGEYYKNCPHCGRLSTETFEVDTNASNHKNTEYVYNSMTERVLHCNDCGIDVKTETVYGIADSNCDGTVNICDFVKMDDALKQGDTLSDNSDLDGDNVIDQNDLAIEKNILLDVYKNVTVDSNLSSNAPANDNTFNTKDMWAALCVVGDEGTVNVVGDYKITDENLELNTHGKLVTVTGEKLDFTDKEIVNFQGNITLKDISVDWNTTAADTKVFANGHKVTIGENVTTNVTLNRIYGGAASGTIESTDLTLLSGSYNMIFGSNENGSVTGTAKLYVGGNVNSELTDSQIQDHGLSKYYVYGGGRYNTSSVGNVHLTIADNAKVWKVYASGIVGTVTDKTEVFFTGGKVMSLFGGFYNAGGSVTHTEVTMTGGWTEQIFGGNEKSGMTNAGSSTKVTVTGGTVVRRIYGGCYNDWTFSYASSYTVNGTTEVYLGGNLVMTSHSDDDNSISAGSRYNNTSTETSTLYITQELLDKYSSKIGAFTNYKYDNQVIVEE